jgi:hypothetical protein
LVRIECLKKKNLVSNSQKFYQFYPRLTLGIEKTKIVPEWSVTLWPPGIPQLARIECRMCLKHIPGCETKHETPRYGIQEGADSNKLVIIGTISLLGLVIAMPDGEFGRRNFRSISSFSSTGWFIAS